jgi:hypothetical protein
MIEVGLTDIDSYIIKGFLVAERPFSTDRVIELEVRVIRFYLVHVCQSLLPPDRRWY